MSNTTSQPETSVTMDTLVAQQHLLQRLYNELDAEQESSATAASEALSVIIRLQGEKAAVKMEAEQYKRQAEEKMCHADESIVIILDTVFQKEMEVATLDYQLQSYRYKLLKMGDPDPGGTEFTYPDNLLQRGETLVTGETSLVRRNSAPLLLKYKKAMNENSEEGNIYFYAEEIRKLDSRVKEIAGPNYLGSRSPPLFSSRHGSLSLPGTTLPSPRPMIASIAKGSNVRIGKDVLEVPQVDERLRGKGLRGKDVVTQSEAVKLSNKDEPNWLKKLFQSTGNQVNLCKPSHIAAIEKGGVQPVLNSANGILEIVEGERVGESSSSSCSREERLKLLKEIKMKLDLIHDEIRSQKVKKSSKREIMSQKVMKKSSMSEEPSLGPLSEAMLMFWL